MAVIISEFSEAQYQSLIESIFRNDFKYNGRYEITYYSGAKERDLGYDLEMLTLIPIYLQVKVSDLHLESAHDLPQIIEQRRDIFNFKDIPGAYYFKLHVDQQDTDYRQHNLLYNLSESGSYARYIAPLFIGKRIIEELNYSSFEINWNNFYNRYLRQEAEFHNWRDYFYMDHSITIKPHKRVTKVPRELHKYYFNRRLETSFHSEPEKVDRIYSLNRFLFNVKRSAEGAKRGNSEEIFKNLINAMRNEVSLTDNEQRAISEINILFEREADSTDFIQLKSFDDCKPIFSNYRILTMYLHEKFNILTYLAGRKDEMILSKHL
jgi:hypothetical protein